MTVIEAVIGDITAQAVDAVVNAANWTLLGGAASTGRSTGPRVRSCWRPAGNCVTPRIARGCRWVRPSPPPVSTCPPRG